MTLEELKSEGRIFLVDKPLEWTSFDAVNKIRYTLCRSFGTKNIKVGHAGTLDPLATGLLIICAGSETHNIDRYQGREKEYTGTFTLGAYTPSFDRETEPVTGFPTSHLTESAIHEATNAFTGDILQRPPVYSALMVDGKRAYQHARKGTEVEMQPRPVSISTFEITDIRMPETDFRVVCSKGTYIRSLADDFGRALGTRAYLSALRRTRIGDFRVEDAMSMEDVVAHITATAEKPQTADE